MKTIGVLAIQGDFSKHLEAVNAVGALGREVRESRDLEGLDGLIIPGGESTTIGKLLDRYAMVEPIRAFALAGKPVFGTCAGAILLSKTILGSSQLKLGLMDIEVKRNAYGRQIESFEADIPCPEVGEIPVRGVFIRAPIIAEVKAGAEILAEYDGKPVLVKQKNLLACTFHPELTNDFRVHRYFLALADLN